MGTGGRYPSVQVRGGKQGGKKLSEENAVYSCRGYQGRGQPGARARDGGNTPIQSSEQ